MYHNNFNFTEVNKVKVFISWSGNKSHKVGMVFRDWLPSVIQTITPYVSSEDIDKGVRWSTDIAKELSDSTFGILCVTKDNLNSSWLSFEAGALSKTMEKTHVAPFLFDIKRSEVNGPILQFQSTTFEKSDIKKLLNTLNKACGESGIPAERLNEAFEVWYPTLETRLKEIEGEKDEKADDKNTDGSQHPEILEEILDLSRENQKLLRNPDTKLSEEIEYIKQKLDKSIMNRERFVIEQETRQPKYRQMLFFMDELSHNDLLKRQKSTAFLMAISFYKDDFPWIYNMGKDLIDTLNSKQGQKVKEDAIRDFREVVDMTSGHPIFRDMIGRRGKDALMCLRNLSYVVDTLLLDISRP